MKKIFTLLSVVSLAFAANAQIVINEVYGGGGNSGSTYKNDFVELKNIGTSTATLTGAYLQYGSAANAFSQSHALPTPITLAPGQTYLVQEGAGTGGTIDLVPDFAAPIPTGSTSGTAGFAMSATAGKVALTSDATLVTAVNNTNVIDLVGFGSTASIFQGTGPTSAPSNTTSISRISNTNDNKADFTAGPPTPQNMASTLAVSDVSKGKSALVKNTVIDNNIVTFAKTADIKIYNLNGQVVKAASVKENSTLDVTALPKGVYIVSGADASQKIIKK